MLTLFILLQIKHWYVDFVLQNEEMIKGKDTYGNPYGVFHSLQHSAFTLALLLVAIDPLSALFLAAFDFVTHYHIDWFKMNYGNADITNPKFWNHLGLDQMAHQIVYGIIIALVHV